MEAIQNKFVVAKLASVYPSCDSIVLLNCKKEEQLELLLATIPELRNSFWM